MFLAEVVGTIVAPVQIPVLDGEKLLLVRPVTPDGRRTGKTRIAPTAPRRRRRRAFWCECTARRISATRTRRKTVTSAWW